MSLSMHQASVPVFVKALSNLKKVLQKAADHAQAKKIEEKTLLTARLFPDMLPLTSQIQIATDISRGVAARLAGMEPPSFEDTEQTFADLYARIDRTVDFLQSIPADKMEDAAARPITRPVRGEPHTFTGANYLLQFGMPNVYFHCTTAYDILRHNGVEIGKSDFLGKFD